MRPLRGTLLESVATGIRWWKQGFAVLGFNNFKCLREAELSRRRCAGRFFGRRVNCEQVPMLPAWAMRRVLDDPRKIPYLLIWLSDRDGLPREAVRVANLGPPPYLPQADSIELKRSDGSVSHIRVLKRPLPRNGGFDTLLACPICCALKRALYGWEADGPYTNSAQTSRWQCRRCAGLRFASEGGALLIRSRGMLGFLFGVGHSPRPDPWSPRVFTFPADAAKARLCTFNGAR
jgi:hypothetical protein